MLGNCFPMLDNLTMINNFVFSHLCLWGPGVLYFVCAVRFCAPRGLCWCCVGKYLHYYISGINLSPYPTCRYWLTDISCPFGCVDDVFVSCIVFLVFTSMKCHGGYIFCYVSLSVYKITQERLDGLVSYLLCWWGVMKARINEILGAVSVVIIDVIISEITPISAIYWNRHRALSVC